MDAYCERLGPGLWGEPLNAVTNAAFLIAAAILCTRRTPPSPVPAWPLPALLAVVGLASLAFHTFATPVTAALDTLSIVAYVLVAVVLLARYGYGWRPGRAWLAAPAFVAFAVAVNAALALTVGEVLGGYLPALLGLAAFAGTLRSRPLGVAAAVFAVSLVLRTLDEPLCDHVPIGTHWLWHCLNAVVLFLVATGVRTAALTLPEH